VKVIEPVQVVRQVLSVRPLDTIDARLKWQAAVWR
jgi:hypothetical protein